MTYLILALGALLALCGALAILAGYPVIQIERGWAGVIAGATALSCGIVTVALGLILQRLTDLAALLKGGRTGAGRPSGIAAGEAAALRLGHSHAGGIPGKRPSGRVAAAVSGLQRRARSGLAAARSVLQPNTARTAAAGIPAAARPIASGREPALDQEPSAKNPEYYGGPSSPASSALAEPKQGEEPASPDPWDFEDSSRSARREEQQSGTGLQVSSSGQHASSSGKEERPAANEGETNFPVMPPDFLLPSWEAFEPPRSEPGLAELAPDPEQSGEELKSHARKDDEEETQETPSPPEHPHQELLGREAETQAPPPSEAPLAADGPPIPVYTDENLAIVSRYESDGTSYVMYSDGSIEARTQYAVFHFKSMDELRAFMEKQAPGSHGQPRGSSTALPE